ncbi:hypothetical protein J2X97_002961 [Epilithonimonas hungarica]|uniref:hypothetical protein n=1 Tax=Epilithonimonas hungarica TaxID=454006 RepID=UPI002783C6B4|nr:hypothetical protein [Epilithonimonas hungarica]MDP9957295.1 hypothetical protein [Epilithonimonas hungarica]
MLSTDRKFHFIAEINITRSKLLNSETSPEDDEVNWLFLILNDVRYSFVYKIQKNQDIKYNLPFTILLAFTFYEFVENEIELNKEYIVQRGEEEIGVIKLIKNIN